MRRTQELSADPLQRCPSQADSSALLTSLRVRDATPDARPTWRPAPHERECGHTGGVYFFDLALSTAFWSVESAATNASCGTSTRPIVFIRFLPSFCFSSSLRLRLMSPP
jgi:hypothetical protein